MLLKRYLIKSGCLHFPAHGYLLGTRPWPPALVLNLYLSTLSPNLYLQTLAPNLYLPALAPSLYLPALAYNFITSPGSEFSIYRPCLLNSYLYLRPLPTICITSQGSEFVFTLLLVVEALVVVIEVVISLE